MEFVPRITRAKNGCSELPGKLSRLCCRNRIFIFIIKRYAMMMTAAGTLKPARVFVIGVGVAGLQAIATAKRLGARVEAFDTRDVVEEQSSVIGCKVRENRFRRDR